MGIFLNQLIQCYSNNMINLRPLTTHIMSCYAHKMAITLWPQIMTSLHPMYHTCFLQSLTSGTFFHNVSTIAAQPVVLWAYFLHWPAITWYQTNIRYPHHPSAVSSFQEIAMRYDHRYNNVQVRWLITNKNVTIVSQADQSCPWVHFVWPNPTQPMDNSEVDTVAVAGKCI